MLGVTAASANKDAASELLSWMYSKENSKLLALLSGTSPCSFAYEDEQILDIYPWLKTVHDSLMIGVRRKLFETLPSFSLPQCESVIGFYAKNAVEGIIDVESAVRSIREELRMGR